MKKQTIKAYINGEEKEIEVWIYDDSDYQLPEPKKMTNVFLMLLSLAITVLVGLYLYFQ